MKTITLLVATIIFLTNQPGVHAMQETNFQLVKVDLTVTNMEKMVVFYSKVFESDFKPVEVGPHKIFIGNIPGLFTIQLVPKQLTGNEVEQNRQQFNLMVNDLDKVIEQSNANGGSQVGEIQNQDGKRVFSVQDPDQNYIVFIGE